MRQRYATWLTALGLAVCLSAAPLAAGPLVRSATQQVTRAAQTATMRPPMRSPEMFWGGVAMAGVGGFLLGRGLVRQPETVSCVSVYAVASCEQTGGSKTPYILGGLGIAGAGFVLTAIGGHRMTVAPTSKGLGLQARLHF